MKNVFYAEKLKDPRWQRKRLEIFERDGWACRNCLDATTELHVHHIKYLPGRLPWDYPNELLVTVCNHCHAKEHSRIDPNGFIENDNDPVQIGAEITRFLSRLKEELDVDEEAWRYKAGEIGRRSWPKELLEKWQQQKDALAEWVKNG